MCVDQKSKLATVRDRYSPHLIRQGEFLLEETRKPVAVEPSHTTADSNYTRHSKFKGAHDFHLVRCRSMVAERRRYNTLN
jgi:hypothetical protein